MVGKTIGNYIVRRKLGEGGMGSVYLAEHPTIGKRVALKVLHAEFASQPEIVSRFFNEAKAVNDIQHPNIVDIIDFGTIPSATPTDPAVVYFIMEYIEGASLTDLIRREAPLRPDRAMPIALQIADALAASHRKGIVHRDLKPDNVMLVFRGREHDFVKLLDFGIAKLTGNTASTHRTRTGMVIGTPQYMSPEQCEGRGNIDHRTDIYALGIVLYQMLTGKAPFVGEGFGEVLVQQMATPPLAPSVIAPQISEQVELVVLKALEKCADNRYQQMDDMTLALQDPARYIETHGGRAGFLASIVLRDPALAGSRPAMAMFTISPGQPAPTTLGGSAAQLTGTRPAKPRNRLLIGLALGVGCAAVGATMILVATRYDNSAAERDHQTAQAPQNSPPSIPLLQTTQSPPSIPSLPSMPSPQPTPSPQPPPSMPSPSLPAVNPSPPLTPPLPAPPTTISIRIESAPSGAQVFVGSEETARGTTPYVLELGRTAAPTEIRTARAGYKPMKKTIAPDSDSKITFTLERAPVSPHVIVKPASTATVPDDSDSDGVIDPFRKKKGVH